MKHLFYPRTDIFLGLALCLLTFTACEPTATDSTTEASSSVSDSKSAITAADRTFVPGKRLGLINTKSTPAAVREAYGEDALVDSLLWGPEGMRYPGYILFPGTDDALELSFSSEEGGVSAEPFEEGGHWTCATTGIRVGTSLATLNRLNGRPFTFSGFGWDYEGNVMDWNGGHLDGHRLKLKYDYYNVDLADGVYGQIMGDHELSSDLPILQDIGVKVDGIYFVLE